MDYKGLFEIHITVDPTKIAELRLFCLKEKLKPIFACSTTGKNKNQLMISKWTSGDYNKAFQKMCEISKKLNDSNITVVRAKIEAMQSNNNIPQDENNIFTEEQHYFEFHMKYIIKDCDEYTALENCAEQYGGAVSFNAFKENINALVTIRIAGTRGLKKAIEIKDEFIEKLKSHNFHSNCEIQREFSVFDSNVEYDEGWLRTL